MVLPLNEFHTAAAIPPCASAVDPIRFLTALVVLNEATGVKGGMEVGDVIEVKDGVEGPKVICSCASVHRWEESRYRCNNGFMFK